VIVIIVILAASSLPRTVVFMDTFTLKPVRRAFTLIELIVVIVIIGILAAVAAVAYNSFIAGANKSATEFGAVQIGKVVSSESAFKQVDMNSYDDVTAYPQGVLDDINASLSDNVAHVTVNPLGAPTQFAIAGTVTADTVLDGEISVCNSDYSYCVSGPLPILPGQTVDFGTVTASGGSGTPSGPSATFTAVDAKLSATGVTLGGTFTDRTMEVVANGNISVSQISPDIVLATSYDPSTPNFVVAANNWEALDSGIATTPDWRAGYVSDADLAVLQTAYNRQSLFPSTTYNGFGYPIEPGAIYPTTCSGNIATVSDQLRTAPVPAFMVGAPVADFMFVKVDREVTDQQVQALPSVFCS